MGGHYGPDHNNKFSAPLHFSPTYFISLTGSLLIPLLMQNIILISRVHKMRHPSLDLNLRFSFTFRYLVSISCDTKHFIYQIYIRAASPATKAVKYVQLVYCLVCVLGLLHILWGLILPYSVKPSSGSCLFLTLHQLLVSLRLYALQIGIEPFIDFLQ